MDWLLWFPGFKTPWLWVAQQCTSSTHPHISGNCQHIYSSDLHSNRGGKRCTIRGGKLADQNRPPIYRLLSKSADLATKKTPNWWLAAQYKNGYWLDALVWMDWVRLFFFYQALVLFFLLFSSFATLSLPLVSPHSDRKRHMTNGIYDVLSLLSAPHDIL